MAGRPNSREVQERLTYISLIGIFTSLFGAVAFGKRRTLERNEITPTDLALLSLATYRAGRLAAYDRVTEPLRDPITETVPDEYDAGENVVADGTGVQKALGELVSCPTCVGTWAAAGMLYGMQIAPGPTRLFAGILAVSGTAEILNSAVEALTWTGQAARKRSAPE
jgi:hypothetical protein